VRGWVWRRIDSIPGPCAPPLTSEPRASHALACSSAPLISKTDIADKSDIPDIPDISSQTRTMWTNRT
jgi:hypothetical protein